jgi:hypothetical protein
MNFLFKLSLFSFCLLSFTIDAQISYSNARVVGLSNASIGLKDSWSLNNCTSEISFLNQKSVATNYSNRFISSDLNEGMFVAILPFEKSAIGVLFSTFGFSSFSNTNIKVGYAYKLSKQFSVGLGGQFRSQNYRDLNNLKEYSYTFDLSTSYQLNENTLLGTSVQHLESFFNSKILYQPIFDLGGSSKLTKDFTFLYKAKGGVSQDFSLHIGGEYSIKNSFYIRTGFSTDKNRLGFGIGYHKNDFRTAISSGYHINLGWTPSFSLDYAF